jgi:hypothetical protein
MAFFLLTIWAQQPIVYQEAALDSVAQVHNPSRFSVLGGATLRAALPRFGKDAT